MSTHQSCDARRVRIWRFTSGKLRRTYDESPEAAAQLQREGPEGLRLEAIDFGRRQVSIRHIRGVHHVVWEFIVWCGALQGCRSWV